MNNDSVSLNHLAINAYPRSGTVFFTNILSSLLIPNTRVSSVHIPYLMDLPQVYQIIPMREPEKCFISEFYRMLLHSNLNLDITSTTIPGRLLELIEAKIDLFKQEYNLYLDYCNNKFYEKYIYILDFNKGIQDPLLEFEAALRQFNLNYSTGSYTSSTLIKNVEDILEKNGLMTESEGHMPIKKSNLRLAVEKYIHYNLDIAELQEKYFLLMQRLEKSRTGGK